MEFLDLTLPSPEANLALDELLLARAEAGGNQTLRFWESSSYFVVLGLGCKVDDDVNTPACVADQVPVLRRASGGGTVLQGPGCLSYALVLRIADHEPLRSITATNAYIMETMRDALAPIAGPLAFQGISDLSIEGLKISGNAQRRKKDWVLFHGTFLYAFDAQKVERYLRIPKRQPDYRANRAHSDFLRNLTVTTSDIKTAVRSIWKATQSAPSDTFIEGLAGHIEAVQIRSKT